MRAVITGATGFAGKWLVKELLEQNDEVTVVVRDKNNLPDEWNELWQDYWQNENWEDD